MTTEGFWVRSATIGSNRYPLHLIERDLVVRGLS
jgi:hypothetical protein